MCVLNYFSHVQLFSALWTVAHQTLLSMGFSRQEFWSGLTSPPPGDFPDPGIEPVSLTSPALAAGFFTTSTTREACLLLWLVPKKQTKISHSVTSDSLQPCEPGSSVHGIL